LTKNSGYPKDCGMNTSQAYENNFTLIYALAH